MTDVCGTLVRDRALGDLIGDITSHDQRLLVAQGGGGGLGKIHFKSSINRTPRKATPGNDGERRELHLELKLLAVSG